LFPYWWQPIKKERNWAKIEALATIAVAVLAGFAIVTAWYASEKANNLTNSISKESLYLQNITSNFQPEIVPYQTVATINDVFTNSTTDQEGNIQDSGTLSISVVVITPHASIINFTDSSFNVVNTVASADWINSSQDCSLPFVYLTPYLPNGNTGANYTVGGLNIINTFISGEQANYWPEAFVQAGVTQENFTVAIHAILPINNNYKDVLIGAYLGSIEAKINLFDVQANVTAATHVFSIPIETNVNI
jgi:hypothetical protein